MVFKIVIIAIGFQILCLCFQGFKKNRTKILNDTKPPICFSFPFKYKCLHYAQILFFMNIILLLLSKALKKELSCFGVQF